MSASRRDFIKLVGAGAALAPLAALYSRAAIGAPVFGPGFGELAPALPLNTHELMSYRLDGTIAFDYRNLPLISLPKDFRYWVVSWTGQTMSDGSRVPGDHDGMAAYRGPRLLITHSPSGAALLADRIVVLEAGRATQEGTPDDIRRRPRTSYAADLAGSNLLVGTAAGSEVTVGDHVLQIADPVEAGPVLLTIHPTAISVHRRPPEGSPRNSWATTVQWIEPLGHRVRLRVGPPLPLTVEISGEAGSALHLGEGDDVWVAVKAAQIGVESEAGT